MSAPDPMVDIATLAARVLAAAVAWYENDEVAKIVDLENGIFRAVEQFKEACGPRSLTWGTVPAGWEVQAPDGQWYRLGGTRYVAATGMQMVDMFGQRPLVPDSVIAVYSREQRGQEGNRTRTRTI